ncbi:MAG: TMEM175 family protein [Candidatus Nanopelagicales bacterium]
MRSNRLEAFSDGVLAIIITIMVLELRAPVAEGQPAAFSDLWNGESAVAPVFLSYVLSFFYIAIYWNNHHHLMQTVDRVTGGILWANMFLLFCISLFPFATAWSGENFGDAAPAAAYGMVLLAAGGAYTLLVRVIIHSQGQDSLTQRAVGRDTKGLVSVVAYTLAIPCAFISAWISYAIFVGVAILWVVPDRRIERVLVAEGRLDAATAD